MKDYPYSIIFIWGTAKEKAQFKKERGYPY
jgi:hypothetical protein